jgi:hypothetical protein
MSGFFRERSKKATKKLRGRRIELSIEYQSHIDSLFQASS